MARAGSPSGVDAHVRSGRAKGASWLARLRRISKIVRATANTFLIGLGQRLGSGGKLRYYPKIVVAAPATPASGQRILLAPQLAPEHKRSVALALIAALRELASDTGLLLVHWLFCTADEQALLVQAEHLAARVISVSLAQRKLSKLRRFCGASQKSQT